LHDHANSEFASGSKLGIDATISQVRDPAQLQTPRAAAHQDG
jgi:3-polyprenyl-4-hydroxybenzoate decarboxylase